MDGKVDAAASGLQAATRVADARGVDAAARVERGSSAAAGSPAAGAEAPEAPSFRPAPEEIPPNWVFAPGFLHADRRGLVPYPGMVLPDGVTATVLLRKYAEAGRDRLPDAKAAYRAAAAAG